MNIRDLEYLVAVEKYRNFHKAADACFVSQPTLSAQLKKLESSLDVTLIERHPGNIRMTEIGERVLERARLIIQHSKDIRQIAKDHGDIFSSSMHIGLIPTIAPYLLPRISKDLKQQFPKLDIKLHELQTHIALQALYNGELDVLVMALPIKQSMDNLSIVPLYDEKFYLAVNTHHPLANRKRLVLDDIKGLDIVLLEKGHCLRDHANDLCKLVNANIDSLFTATSLETLRHMITVNEVMTLMPELAIKQPDKDSAIVYIPFLEKKLSREIALVYRKKSYKEQIFSQLAKLIKQAV